MSNKKKMFVATFWVTAAFGLSQLVRLGSNLITTRILEPEVFGVLAVVYAIYIGVEMFSDIGLFDYVVRHENPHDNDMLNTVWSVQVVRGFFVFLLLAIAACLLYFLQAADSEYLSGVYSNNQLPLLIFIVGITSAVTGLRTMVNPLISRTMSYGKLEMANIASQFIGISTMLIWLWLSPSIWAIVITGVLSNSISCFFSYYLFDYRHKFVINQLVLKDLFRFSKWIVISTALTYLFSQGDKLYLGAKVAGDELGIYSIAFMLSATMISILDMIARKIVFPSMSTIATSTKEVFKNRYYKIRLMIDAPLFFGLGFLFAIAPALIDFMYDDRYIDAGWMLQVLLISVVGTVLTTIGLECLKALSETKINMWAMLIRSIGLVITLPILFEAYGLKGAVWAIACNVWLAIPVIFFTLSRYKVLSIARELMFLPLLPLGFYLTKSAAVFFNISL